ncbi:MAG: hypothetical protein DELT_02667 [Desulfovibrio sp.]
MSLKDFVLLAKLEALDLESHKIVKKFEKSERHVLSADIRHTTASLLRQTIFAVKTQQDEGKKKRPPIETKRLLFQLDTEIEYFKTQVRKAYALKLINEKTYEKWSRQIQECGGLLGGWIKGVDERVGKFQDKAPPASAQKAPEGRQGSLI